MKKIVSILILATAVAANAAQTNGPKVRVSPQHDHTPTIHSRAAVAHK